MGVDITLVLSAELVRVLGEQNDTVMRQQALKLDILAEQSCTNLGCYLRSNINNATHYGLG